MPDDAATAYEASLPAPNYVPSFNDLKAQSAAGFLNAGEAPGASQLAQQVQMQGGSFSALVKADQVAQRTHGLNSRVETWVGKEQAAVAADTLRVVGPNASPDTIAQVTQTLNAEAETQAAPAMPRLFHPSV